MIVVAAVLLDGLILIIVLLVAGALLGLVFGWVSFFNTLNLRKTIELLERQIGVLRRRLDRPESAPSRAGSEFVIDGGYRYRRADSRGGVPASTR